METNLVVACLYIVFLFGVSFGCNFIVFINDVSLIRRVLTKKSYIDAENDFNLLRYSEILFQEQKKQDP